MVRPSGFRIAFAALLVVSAVLFAVGVHAERSGHHETTTSAPTAESHNESGGESAGEGSATASTKHSETTSERVLGLDVETGPTVALAVIASLVLAAGVILLPRSRALVCVAMAFSLAAGIFDLAEVGHQVSRSDTALTVLAAVLAVMHFAAVFIGYEVQRERIGLAD